MGFLDDFSQAVYDELGRAKYNLMLQQYFPYVDSDVLQFVGEMARNGIDLSPYVATADTEGFYVQQLRVIAEGLARGLDVSMYAKHVFSYSQMVEVFMGLCQGLDVTKYAKPIFTLEQMEVIRIALILGFDITPYIKTHAVTEISGKKEISSDRLKSLSYCLEHNLPEEKIDYLLNVLNLPFNKLVYVVDTYSMGIDLCQLLANAENTDARSLDNWSPERLVTLVALIQCGVDVCEGVASSTVNMIDIIFGLSGTVAYITDVLHTIKKGAKRGIDFTKIPYPYYKTPDIIHIINGMIDGYAIEDIVLV